MTKSVRLRWLLDEVDDRAGERARDLPLLSVSITTGVRRRDETEGPTRAASEDLSKYKVCSAGDLVINRMRAFQGALGVAPETGVVSPDYSVLRISPLMERRWLNYFLTSGSTVAEMASLVRGIGGTEAGNVRTPRLNVSDLHSIRIRLESLEAQCAIADYLDRETSRIDTLIAGQQRLIEMLRERRKAAATSELGARVGTGERLKWYLEELDIRASEVSAVLPLMSVSIDWGVRRRDEVTADESRAADLSNYKVCRRDDIVINRMRAFQGALGLAPEDGIVSPDYAVLRASPKVNGAWLVAVMRTDRFVAEMASRIKGIGSADLGAARTPRINIRDLADIRVDVPLPETQSDEATRLRQAVSEIETLVVETERFIELARERRTSLITAAVNGQIDIPEVA